MRGLHINGIWQRFRSIRNIEGLYFQNYCNKIMLYKCARVSLNCWRILLLDNRPRLLVAFTVGSSQVSQYKLIGEFIFNYLMKRKAREMNMIVLCIIMLTYLKVDAVLSLSKMDFGDGTRIASFFQRISSRSFRSFCDSICGGFFFL